LAPPAAATAALLGAQCYAGWGGLIVLPVVQGKGGFIRPAGRRIVSAACVIVLKALAKKKASDAKADDELDLDFEIN
jgi:fructose-specific PTS system IIC-like component